MTFFTREVTVGDFDLEISQQYVGDVGGVVWDAALVLNSFLEQLAGKVSFINKNIIELGAGTGVCGLVSATLGADVIISDLKDFVPLMQKNVAENKKFIKTGKIEALEIDWRQFCQEEDPENALDIDGTLRSKLIKKFDYILVSDCIYYDPAVGWLASCLDALTSKETTVYISLELRPEKTSMVKLFFTKLKEKGFRLSLEEDIPEAYKCDDIQVWSARRL